MNIYSNNLHSMWVMTAVVLQSYFTRSDREVRCARASSASHKEHAWPRYYQLWYVFLHPDGKLLLEIGEADPSVWLHVTAGTTGFASQIPPKRSSLSPKVCVSHKNVRSTAVFHADVLAHCSVVAIFCGGFATADPSLLHFYPLSLPTLHVLGRGDTIVTEERSQTLIRRCQDARVEQHDGGHFIPSKATWRHFFK
jgi:hypothetical protein